MRKGPGAIVKAEDFDHLLLSDCEPSGRSRANPRGDLTQTSQSRLDEISESGYIFSRKKKRTEVPPPTVVVVAFLEGEAPLQ